METWATMCEQQEKTSNGTSNESHLFWEKNFHKIPLYFTMYADFEADNYIDNSDEGKNKECLWTISYIYIWNLNFLEKEFTDKREYPNKKVAYAYEKFKTIGEHQKPVNNF